MHRHLPWKSCLGSCRRQGVDGFDLEPGHRLHEDIAGLAARIAVFGRHDMRGIEGEQVLLRIIMLERAHVIRYGLPEG